MTTNENPAPFHAVELETTATIAAAYFAKHMVATGEIASVISAIRGAVRLEIPAPSPEVAPLVPAVEIRRSIRPEGIYCLECGTPHTSIKRHLSAQHGLTPDAYRAKWGLRPEYPMVTAAYSAKRSELAKQHGLGRK